MRTRRNHASTTTGTSLAYLNKLAAITGVVTACAAALGGACSDPDPSTTGAGGKGMSSSSSSGKGGQGGEDLNVVAGSVTIGSNSGSSSSGPLPPKCGMPDPNGGKTKAAFGYGDATMGQIGTALTFDKSGNMLMAGSFSGSINFGGTTLTGTNDVFVAKFNPSGGLLWAKSFGDGNVQSASGIGVDANGNVYLAGSFKGSINFGGGTFNADGTLFIDIFLAKFTSDGTHVWSQKFGDPQDVVQNVQGLAVDSAGDVVITGFFQGGVNFGGAVLKTAGDYDVFVAKFNTGGTHQWSRRFGDGAGDQNARAVTLDAAGNVYLAGDVTGSIDFGGGAMSTTSTPSAFVTKLDSLGNVTWVKLSEGTANDKVYANSIAVGPNGEVAVGGYFDGTFALGGTAVGGVDNAFVTLLSAAGAHTYTKTFGDTSAQSVTGVAIAPNGEVYAAGNFSGSIDLETGEPSVSAGKSDGFLARLNSKGCPTWLRTFTGPDVHSTKALALDPTTGGVALTGTFSGAVDFGTGDITAAADDVFLLSVNP